MESQNDIFCSNHSQKFAKRHCNKCNLDLCNECALDNHIDHYKSLQKLKYIPKKKFLNYSEILSEEIKKIINNSLNDFSSQIYNNISEKAIKSLEDYKKKQPKFINSLRNKINVEEKKLKKEEKVEKNEQKVEKKEQKVEKKEQKVEKNEQKVEKIENDEKKMKII